MKKLLLSLSISSILYAGFFETSEMREQKELKERARFCEFFTQKANEYEKKGVRDDELAQITLSSYKNRAKIYCSNEIIKVKEAVKKEVIVKALKKNIALEDERLCNIFKNKIEKYKSHMRQDELAYVTLESYKKRAYIFCTDESLEKKEKAVLKEDEKLCEVFKQGPKLCHKFDMEVIGQANNPLAEPTKKSFEKRAKVFCSSKPLDKKDEEVYKENEQLCQLYYDNIELLTKEVQNNKSANITLKALRKRVDYFCGSSKK